MRYFLVGLAILMIGCSSENRNSGTFDSSTSQAQETGPSRQLVLDLLNKRLAPKVVRAYMNTSSNVRKDFTPVYTQMIDDKFISCDKGRASCACWTNCRPAGDQMQDIYLEQEEQGAVTGTLAIDIGIKEVREVTGVSVVDRSSAVAEYRVVYTQNDDKDIAVFKKYPQVFRVDNMQNETHRAYLRRYDDGWRIERLN
jgi:hypothetical protein